MKLLRLSLVVVAISAVAAVALVAHQAPPTGAAMAAAADKFLAALTPEQKAKAAFTYDDPQREKWYFTPQQKQRQPTRKGVRLDELTADQKAAALNLLRAGLSTHGYDQAATIMSLEAILAELETKGSMVRNPQWYFVSIFGKPSNTGAWGWRIEGHHLSVNLTLDKGEIVTATPLVFGANPAEVRSGPRKGLRTLPETEIPAKALIASLTAEQKKVALQPKQQSEIKEGQPTAGVGAPVGLPAAKMTAEQKALLQKLLEGYANRLPADIATAELKRVRDAGPEKVHFSYWVGEDRKGKPYTYRVQGPTFVVEFLNVQADSAGNPANHIHSGWRRLPADFGLKGS
ncbi:MAG TPA: DUF3500 domain-containing protein [Fimbriiglobus sp.]|nr:DUF3500 domain-containing protein [Fimbriiglobus sp.]